MYVRYEWDIPAFDILVRYLGAVSAAAASQRLSGQYIE